MPKNVTTSGSFELFLIRHCIQAGPLGCEHIGTPNLYNGRLQPNNSIDIVYVRMNIIGNNKISVFTGFLSKYFEWVNKFIDDKDAYRHALTCITEHHAIPENRRELFARAIEKLANDAKSSSPMLLFTILDGALPDKPSTIVTEASDAVSRSSDFPKTAPEKWIPRGSAPPEEFAVRVYGKWMKPDTPHLSIGMPEILHLDEPLYNALRRTARNKKPEGFFLPSKSERVRETIRLINEGKIPMPEDYKTRNSLATVAWRNGGTLSPKK
jgi:hypothetical protein